MKCAVDDCERPPRTRGWCDMHYRRWKTHGSPLLGAKPVLPLFCDRDDCTEQPVAHELCKRHYYAAKREAERALRPPPTPPPPKPVCLVSGCGVIALVKGWCGAHYQRWRRFGDPEAFPTEKRKRCSMEGCEKVTNARGLCSSHYYRWQKYGDPSISKNKPRSREYVPVLPPRACATCGNEFDPGNSYIRRYCNRRCRPTRAAAGVNNRATVERLARLQGWTCALCDEAIDSERYWPNTSAGSVDHIKPVVEGGLDDLSNLQLVHLGCNLAKEGQRRKA